MSEWQPIETAPKDGTRVILACSNIVVTGFWRGQTSIHSPGWWTDWLVGTYGDKPTHWMPLPNPPETK